MGAAHARSRRGARGPRVLRGHGRRCLGVRARVWRREPHLRGPRQARSSPPTRSLLLCATVRMYQVHLLQLPQFLLRLIPSMFPFPFSSPRSCSGSRQMRRQLLPCRSRVNQRCLAQVAPSLAPIEDTTLAAIADPGSSSKEYIRDASNVFDRMLERFRFICLMINS
ncbi:uncharacterized protein LOC120710598 [Panicum virgatum]|uniref:uncharacterized protein LOC120710598 n=1 Tax=Panicum virgatum TaxID=38727 RepID=UPI0019D554CB|nr:uncharacterized protein LOC120710598 [Panicum virgatum]